jgi:hypothetical protein
MGIKTNYLHAIYWIDEQLTKPTKEVKMKGETIHDLHYSLKLNRNQILEDRGNYSYAAFCRTKRIKDYLNEIR